MFNQIPWEEQSADQAVNPTKCPSRFFGCPGTLNDISIFDQSPLRRAMLNGSSSTSETEYIIVGQLFHELFYLADGIYPDISLFLKARPSPLESQH